MSKILRLCIVQFLATAASFASQDLFAPPLYSHTQFALPEPYKTGEIEASGQLKDVGRGEKMMELLALKVTIGETKFVVPQGVLDLFPGANLATLRFFVGPPDNPDFPMYSEKPKPGEPAYFVVTFLCHAWPHDAGVNADNGTTAQIVLKEGKILNLYRSTHTKSGELGEYHSVSYDPATLREVPRGKPAGAPGGMGKDGEPRP